MSEIERNTDPLQFKRIANGLEVVNKAGKYLGKIVWHGCMDEYVFVPSDRTNCLYIDYMNDILISMRLLQGEREGLIMAVGP